MIMKNLDNEVPLIMESNNEKKQQQLSPMLYRIVTAANPFLYQIVRPMKKQSKQ